MGNYLSRQEQLEQELALFFSKIIQQTTIKKIHVIQVSRKFAALKEENPARYTTISNRAKNLVNTTSAVLFKGRAITKDWEKLQTLYKEFQEMCPQYFLLRSNTLGK